MKVSYFFAASIFVMQLAAVVSSFATEPTDRLSELLIEFGDGPSKYSTVYAVTILSEPDAYESDYFVTESIVQRAVDEDRRINRIDICQNKGDVDEVASWEHWLIDKGARTKATAYVERSTLKVMALSEQAPMPMVHWLNVDLCKLPISNLFGTMISGGFDFLDTLAKHTPISGKTVERDYIGLYYNKSLGSLISITYMNEPRWLPTCIRFYEIPKGTQISQKDAFDQLSKCRMFAQTRTSWKKLASGEWVPMIVSMMHNDKPDGPSAEAEVIFADWKFKSEVEDQLLNSKNFTKTELLQIDFAQIRDKIKASARSMTSSIIEKE